MHAKNLIFISHRAEEKELAGQIKTWINTYFGEDVDAFVADLDIKKGKEWIDQLKEHLVNSGMVFCLCSPQSVQNSWMLFESGGAWGAEKEVVPICHSGMAPDLLPDPYSSFQAYKAEGSGFIVNLIEHIEQKFSIRKRRGLNLGVMEKELEVSTSRLRDATEYHDVFLSTPMTSFQKSDQWPSHREEFQKILTAIRKRAGLSKYYFSGENMLDDTSFDPAPIGAFKDLSALQRSRRFIMIYPERVPTSCIAEAGIALAKKMPSVYFFRDQGHLPYALTQVNQVYSFVKFYPYTHIAEIAKTIEKYGTELFLGSGSGEA